MFKITLSFSSVLLFAIMFINMSLAQDNKGKQLTKVKNIVANTAEEICPILVGEKIPNLTLTTIYGEQFNLNKAITATPTILVIYRGGWCPYCNRQLEQLRLVEPDLISFGYQLIAISIDRPTKLKESLDKHNLNYTLLSDSNASAAIALGLAFKVDNETINKYKNYNIDFEAASGKNHHILPVPAVFIIGQDETIKFEYINPNYSARLNSELLLSSAKFYIEEMKKNKKE